MKEKIFHILSPFTVKASTTPVHDPNMVSTGNSEIIKISGVANYYGDPDTGELLIDLASEIVDPNGMDVSLFKTNPQILWQHDRNCTIGRGTSITKKKSGIYIEAEIHAGAMEEEQFYRVRSGLISYLSIGFRTLEGKFSKVGDKNVYVITKSQLHEISLVSMPCNTESSFQIVKSLPDGEGFYGGELKDSTPEVLAPFFKSETLENLNENNINQEGETMKLKFKDVISAEEAVRFKELGLEAKLEEETDVDIKAYIDLQMKANTPAGQKMRDTIQKCCVDMLTDVFEDAADDGVDEGKEGDDGDGEGASDPALILGKKLREVILAVMHDTAEDAGDGGKDENTEAGKAAAELVIKEAQEKEAEELAIKEAEEAETLKTLTDIVADFKKSQVTA